MSEISTILKRCRDIMRRDASTGSDFTRLQQMTWLLFLKAYDAREEEWELEDGYRSIVPDALKWRNWAADRNGLTSDALIDFVNGELFPGLRNIHVDEDTPARQAIVKSLMASATNYMRDGTSLKEVIEALSEVDFTDYNEVYSFNEFYESMLRLYQEKGTGEYYTPRPVTDFIVETIDPRLNETVADFACGTGGFLIAAMNHLRKQQRTTEDMEVINRSLFGIEKVDIAYLLGVTNLILHNVDNPLIYHDNSLSYKVGEYNADRPADGNRPADKVDVIVMNPPYGGVEKEDIKSNFPMELRSSETADLFMVLIMYRLQRNGRAGVIMPPGFLFGTDDVKGRIKEYLMANFNLHTIVRLPQSVFAPYTPTQTNILFFDNDGPTKETWIYRMDMPEGYKHFSKTKPIRYEHMAPVIEWMRNKVEIYEEETDSYKAKCYSIDEIKAGRYNLDLCKYTKAEEEILSPQETIANYKAKRKEIDANIDAVLEELEKAIGFSIGE